MRKNVVVSESVITAGQLVNFFQGVKIDEKSGRPLYSFDNFQQYLQDPNRLSLEKTPLDRAIRLLGSCRVVTAEQWCEAWGREIADNGSRDLCFSERLLQSAADSNKAGTTDYRLVYCGGISLHEQWEILGDLKSPPYFRQDYKYLLSGKWAKHQPKPGYRLLDYKPRLFGYTWYYQEKEIAQLGEGFSRAHGAEVTEGCFSFYKVWQIRLMQTVRHWGPSKDSEGIHITVGEFQEKGIVMDTWPPGNRRGYLGVVISRRDSS